jgi:hypothetical protein
MAERTIKRFKSLNALKQIPRDHGSPSTALAYCAFLRDLELECHGPVFARARSTEMYLHPLPYRLMCGPYPGL